MTTQHTKEPLLKYNKKLRALVSQEKVHLVEQSDELTKFAGGYVIATDVDEANAARIVACVNGCEGINPAAIPFLLRALKIARGHVKRNALTSEAAKNDLEEIEKAITLAVSK